MFPSVRYILSRAGWRGPREGTGEGARMCEGGAGVSVGCGYERLGRTQHSLCSMWIMLDLIGYGAHRRGSGR